MKCNECNGAGRVKVGWHPVPNSTYKIRVEYAPCPKCSLNQKGKPVAAINRERGE